MLAPVPWFPPAGRMSRLLTPALVALAIALPALWPLAPGPSVNAVPLLVAWSLVALTVLALPGGGTWRWREPALLLAFFVAATAASGAVGSPDWWATGAALLAVGACGVIGRAAQTDHTLARTLALGWVTAGTVSAAIAWLQFSGQSAEFYPWVNLTSVGEAFGNLRQRNLFATLTSLAVLALIWLGATCKDQPGLRGGILVAGLVLVAGNALSVSRTGFFQLVLILALCLTWGMHHHRALRPLLWAMLPFYAAAAIGLPALLGLDAHVDLFTRLTEGAPACSSRVALWSNVLELIAQHPWSGWGWGRLDQAHYEHLYAGLRFCDILDNAHNLPLHLAVELGVPVALVFCGAAGWWCWRGRPWRERDPLRQMAWGFVAILGLHSLLEYPLWYGPFQIALGLALGLLSQGKVASPPGPGDPARPAGILARHLKRLLPVSALGLLIAAAWDYGKVSQIYLAPEARGRWWQGDAFALAGEAWFFQAQGDFARLTLTPPARDNAASVMASAQALIAYSPEPRVIERLIEGATLAGQDELALWHLARYRAAFPAAHAQWARGLHAPLPQRPAPTTP